MKKRNNKKGFTLAELLIVVAIIGVLVAISFPIFAGKMEKARIATDKANVRAAYAEATAALMLNEVEARKEMYFDADAGKLVETKPEKTYGKTTKENDEFKGFCGLVGQNGQGDDDGRHENGVIKVIFKKSKPGDDSKIAEEVQLIYFFL